MARTPLRSSGVRVNQSGSTADGVDALLGAQTRPHKDLDIAIEQKDVAALREFLHKRGYRDVKLEIVRPYA
jgi:hypothetical protein